MTTHQKQADAFRRGNVMVAEIIIAVRQKYPAGSLMREVAEMTLKGGVNIRRELERRAGVTVNSSGKETR